jgi:nucleoside-diphosphate-sugar epimerase
MRILVTGGAGFIGGNLARALSARGDEVIVFDNLATYHNLDAIAGLPVELVHGDVRCPEDLARVGKKRLDRIYHLASSFANELSLEHPLLDTRTNVDGTRNVLRLARETECGLFVYAGTSSSYGDASVPTDEEAPIRPQTPYARSKHEAELRVRETKIPSAVFRLFNVYGPGDPPGRYRNAIPNMVRDLERGPLKIYGREATRDFTYINDVVRVLLDASRAAGEIVNVGSGVETRVVDLAAMLLELVGHPHDHMTILPPREWDRVTRRCANVAKLERLFGWKPSTPLAEGLRDTVAWLRR